MGHALLPTYDTICSLFKDAVPTAILDENWQGDKTENAWKNVVHDFLKVAIFALDNASDKRKSNAY